MTREKCREELLKDLKEQDLLIKIEEMTHSVGHSERSDAVVEPYISKQWFVKMRPLEDRVLENQKNKNKKVNFVPKRFEKVLNHWMEISYDWCISRQLWWGHRIPAYYCEDCKEIHVAKSMPEKCTKCGSTNTAEYLYGLPKFDDNLQKELDELETELRVKEDLFKIKNAISNEPTEENSSRPSIDWYECEMMKGLEEISRQKAIINNLVETIYLLRME